ncbi:MAG: 50S ribosomal protein L9 [Pseudomonadota bacterium]|nr:50S ribosomal protein L9 [Pseudomonadota bacterium]
MKVILQEEVANLGTTGEVVEVADGYGRNYLLPRSLAVLADERNTRRLDHQRRLAAARQSKVLAAAKELAAKISGTAVSIKRQAGAEDKIFGSVTNQDVQEALAAQGVEVDRRNIVLAEPIRNIGVFQVPIKVHRDVEASVKVYVIRG